MIKRMTFCELQQKFDDLSAIASPHADVLIEVRRDGGDAPDTYHTYPLIGVGVGPDDELRLTANGDELDEMNCDLTIGKPSGEPAPQLDYDKAMTDWVALIERHKKEQHEFMSQFTRDDVDTHNLVVWCLRRAYEILPSYSGAHVMNYQYEMEADECERT